MQNEELTQEEIQELIEDSLDLLKYKYSKYGQAIKDQTGGDQVEIKPNQLENYVAKVMKTAGFVVEGPGDLSVKEVVIEIADMCREYMTQKQLDHVKIQQVCALIATFIKRGEGDYQVLNTNEESEDSSDDSDEETQQQPSSYHLPEELKSEQLQQQQRQDSATTVRNQQDYYYNFDEQKMKPRGVTIPPPYAVREVFKTESISEDTMWTQPQQYSGVFEYISYLRSEETLIIPKTSAVHEQLLSNNSQVLEYAEIMILPRKAVRIELQKLDILLQTNEIMIHRPQAVYEQIEINQLGESLMCIFEPLQAVYQEVTESNTYQFNEVKLPITQPFQVQVMEFILDSNEVFDGLHIKNAVMEEFQYSLEVEQEGQVQSEVVNDLQNKESLLKEEFDRDSNDQDLVEEQTLIQQSSTRDKIKDLLKDIPASTITHSNLLDQNKFQPQLQHQMHKLQEYTQPILQQEEPIQTQIHQKLRQSQLRVSRSMTDLQKVLHQDSSGRDLGFETHSYFMTPLREKTPQPVTPNQHTSKLQQQQQTNEIKFSDKYKTMGQEFSEKEQMTLADLQMKQVFKDFAKQQCSVAGHQQTFDRLGQGFETLILRDVMKLLKMYDVRVSKQKLQFMFKRHGTMGMFVDFDQFKLMMQQVMGVVQMTAVYEKFRCYPVSTILQDQLKEERKRSESRDPRFAWFMTVQDREARVVSTLRKKLEQAQPKATPSRLKAIAKRKLIDEEDYVFKLSQKLQERKAQASRNLTGVITDQQTKRGMSRIMNLRLDSNPYTNLTIDHANTQRPKPFVTKRAGPAKSKFQSFQAFIDGTDHRSVSSMPGGVPRYQLSQRGSGQVKLPSIHNRGAGANSQLDDHQQIQFQRVHYGSDPSNVNLVKSRAQIYKQKLKQVQQLLPIRDLESSYSENDGNQFHLDSLPAVLGEFVQVLKIIIHDTQNDAKSLQQPIEQDLEVLDTVVAYITTQFKSQFINDETLMLNIEDVVALVDRFLREANGRYKVIDTAPLSVDDSVKIKNGYAVMKESIDKVEVQSEIKIELRVNAHYQTIQLEGEGNMEQPNISHVEGQTVQPISIKKRDTDVQLRLPSPRFANVQYLEEREEEEQMVITLDEGLLPSRNTVLIQQQSSGLSIKDVILKTIADYQKILDNKDYQDDTEKLRIEQIIKELYRQLEEKTPKPLNTIEDDEILSNIKIDPLPIIEEVDLLIDGKKLSNLTPEDEKMQNLQEIFLIYCRQHVMIGKNPTFEDIKKEVRNLNLGEFLKFCKDFKIELPRQKVTEVFKKTALYSREMYFSHFKVALVQLMKEQNKIQINQIKQQYKEVKFALKQAEASQQPDQEQKENKSQAIEQLQQRAKKLTNEHQQLRLANEDDQALFKKVTEDIIQVQDPAKYHKKIKGFTLAFGIRDKQERLHEILGESPPSNQGTNPKLSQQASFRPFLYKDQYRNKIHSVVRTEIDQHQKKHLDTIQDRSISKDLEDYTNQTMMVNSKHPQHIVERIRQRELQISQNQRMRNNVSQIVSAAYLNEDNKTPVRMQGKGKYFVRRKQYTNSNMSSKNGETLRPTLTKKLTSNLALPETAAPTTRQPEETQTYSQANLLNAQTKQKTKPIKLLNLHNISQIKPLNLASEQWLQSLIDSDDEGLNSTSQLNDTSNLTIDRSNGVIVIDQQQQQQPRKQVHLPSLNIRNSQSPNPRAKQIFTNIPAKEKTKNPFQVNRGLMPIQISKSQLRGATGYTLKYQQAKSINNSRQQL